MNEPRRLSLPPSLIVIVVSLSILGLLLLVSGDLSLNNVLFSGYLSMAMLNVSSPLATLGLALTDLKAAAWRSGVTAALFSLFVVVAARSGSLWMSEMEPLLWCGVLFFTGGGFGTATWLVLQNRQASR